MKNQIENISSIRLSSDIAGIHVLSPTLHYIIPGQFRDNTYSSVLIKTIKKYSHKSYTYYFEVKLFTLHFNSSYTCDQWGANSSNITLSVKTSQPVHLKTRIYTIILRKSPFNYY